MPRIVAPAIAPGTMSAVAQPSVAVDDTLQLRPFLYRDVDRIIEAYTDPDIRHWHSRGVDSVLDARRLIGSGHARWLREESAEFAIVGPDDRLIGRVALHTSLWAGTAEIAFWVLPDARRGGVAARAARAATRWGHEWLGLSRILLEHAVSNTASCAVAQSLDYELEGTSRSVQLLADGRHDVHVHAHLPAT